MNEEELIEGIVPSDWTNSDEVIKVLGVGGGGCNAVDYMYRQGIQGCTFAICNTDAQALRGCSVPLKIPIGPGLGAGTKPELGRRYALEGADRIAKAVLDTHTRMLFITAGMGGGTGTGAAPVIAEMARERGILTVAVVTLPFRNEGTEALTRAIDGIHLMERNVDSLILINNEKLHEYYGNQLIRNALPQADEVLATAVRSIIEIIKKRGYINVDFQDVETMMRGSGLALMGCGTGSGPDRIDEAVRAAFESPLLNDFDLKTARNVLINITCSADEHGLTMDDLSKINDRIDEYTGRANNFKRGLIWEEDPAFGDTVRITSIVTGLRLTDVLRPEDTGNYVMIGRDFVYERDRDYGAKELDLSEEDGFRKAGAPSAGTGLPVRNDPDRKPALVILGDESRAEMENVPAIQRARSISGQSQ